MSSSAVSKDMTLAERKKAADKTLFPLLKYAYLTDDMGELRSRIESIWVNIAVLGAFVSSMPLTVMFGDLPFDTKGSEAKMCFTIAFFSFILLIVSVLFATVNITTLSYVPDIRKFMQWLGPRLNLPIQLLNVGILFSVTSVLMYSSMVLGAGVELVVSVIVVVLAVVASLAHFAVCAKFSLDELGKPEHWKVPDEEERE